jgi:hypothetical protein
MMISVIRPHLTTTVHPIFSGGGMVSSGCNLCLEITFCAPHLMMRRTAILVAMLCVSGAAAAQSRLPIMGRTVDIESRSLSGVTIEIVDRTESTTSLSDGSFTLLAPATGVALRASKRGYAPAIIPRAHPGDTIVIRLTPTPVFLQGLTVEVPRASTLTQTVTAQTVAHVPALVEPDIFRAIVLLSGVSQPNDLKGRIHLAGGASDETGILLDGHPLQDPFHLLGLLGAFPVTALDRADVLIHHLPPGFGNHLSGIIDLHTRQIGDEVFGEISASVLSASATIAVPPSITGIDLLVNGRVTYLERLGSLLFADAPRMGFYDGLIRVGRDWGAWRTEFLAFRTEDYYAASELKTLEGYKPLKWGETMVGVRAYGPVSGWQVSARASSNRAQNSLDERTISSDSISVLHPKVIGIQRDWLSAALEASRRAGTMNATLGASVDLRSNEQHWHTQGIADEIFSPNTPDIFEGNQELSLLNLFGGVDFSPREHWIVTLGARLSGERQNVHIAPRALVAWRASDRVRIEAAANRRHQWDTQLEEPIEGSISPPRFFLDQPRTVDMLAMSTRIVGPAAPTGPPWDLTLHAFWKQYANQPRLRVRTQGDADQEALFPVFEHVRGYGTGLTAGGKLRIGDAALVQGSYTLQQVRENTGGSSTPPIWDVPHTLSLLGSTRLGLWTLSAAYQGHSGRATTPVVARTFEPFPDRLSELRPRYIRGERNSIRVPAYHRVDVGARRAWEVRGVEAALRFQVLNLFMRENPVDYDWQQYFGWLGGAGRERAGRSGIPILPSIGLEVKW